MCVYVYEYEREARDSECEFGSVYFETVLTSFYCVLPTSGEDSLGSSSILFFVFFFLSRVFVCLCVFVWVRVGACVSLVKFVLIVLQSHSLWFELLTH